jgi:hypothetical protein
MRKHLSKIVAAGSLFALQANNILADTGTLKITKGKAGVTEIGVLISSAFNAAILIAVIAVFGMLILGGYGWITAGGDKGKVEEARTRITNALIGLAIVAAAWALINIIGKFFGVEINNITLPSATGSTGNGGL